MSVIQKIRGKYSMLVVILIVIALIGFLVMDAMQSNVSRIFGGDQSLLAEVNGQRIDYKTYEETRSQYEDNMRARSKEGNISEEERKQVQEQAYTDMVNDILYQGEISKLGFDLTDSELRDMETGSFIDPNIRQGFTDPKTGQFDPNSVSQHLSSFAQDKTGEKRRQWEKFEKEMIRNKIRSKYTDMISKGIYVPKFVLDRENKDRNTIASINYVSVPYTSISDSAVSISDDDVKQFIEKRKKLMISQEDKAKLEYVSFDIIPSSDDTAQSLGVLNKIKPEFEATTDNESFVSNNSEETFNNSFVSEDKIEMPNPAEVIAATVGAVVGPVFMNGSFKMVKVLGKKSMADSAKASHILIKISEQRSEETAKKMIDSLESVVKAGAPLEMLAAQVSEDEGTKAKGGDLGYFPQGAMVKEFNEFCFEGAKGEMKVVKTQFGYHLIKITDQKAFKPAAKLAVVAKLLQAGTTTSQAVFAKANEFTNKAKDTKSFADAAKAMGKDKRVAEGITKVQSDIQGIGSARDVARWAYEAKLGAVSQIFNLEDKLVIALLTERKAKGELPTVAELKPQIEPMLKKEKKGTMLVDKYKGKGSLEEIAAAAGAQMMTADTLKIVGGAGDLAYEQRVLGACLNKANLNKKSAGIPGESGVYFVFVKGVKEDAAASNAMPVEMQRQQLQMNAAGQATQMIPYILKMKAKITDNRGSIF